MKIPTIIFLILFTSISFAEIVEFELTPYKAWVNTENNKLNAKLLKYDTNRGRIYLRDGLRKREFWYSLDKLRSKDYEYVYNLYNEKHGGPDPRIANLYNQSYYDKTKLSASWKWYDLKYLKLEKPFVLNKDLFSKYATIDSTNVVKYVDIPFDHVKRNACSFLAMGKKALPENYAVNVINFIKILLAYGMTEKDLNKLKWHFHAEDFLHNQSKILNALGIDHYVGSYNYRKVKKYIDMGFPLLAVQDDRLGDESNRYHYAYRTNEHEDKQIAKEIRLRKIHYLKF